MSNKQKKTKQSSVDLKKIKKNEINFQESSNNYEHFEIASTSNENNKYITSIKELTDKINDYTIIGKVIEKSNINYYRSGNGTYFNFILLDDTESIKITCFEKECSKFFELIQLDCFYKISEGKIKNGNKLYNKVTRLELNANQKTVIELITPTNEYKKNINIQQHKWTKLCNISKMNNQTNVNIIFAIIKVGEIKKFPYLNNVVSFY